MDNIYQIDPNGYSESDVVILKSQALRGRVENDEYRLVTPEALKSLSIEGFTKALYEITADAAKEAEIDLQY